MRKLFVFFLLAFVLSEPSLADEPLETAAEAVQSAATVDEQLAEMYDLSVTYASDLENGGWDVNMTIDPADSTLNSMIPSVEDAEDADGLPETLKDAKFIALYRYGADDNPVLLGDFQVRLPQANRAVSAAEADAILLLTERFETRNDYVGSASDRVYEIYAVPIGGKAIRIYEKITTPPIMGSGPLSGEKVSMEALWRGIQPMFYGAEITVGYPEGTAYFRITGEGCCMTGLEGDFKEFEIPQSVNGYPVQGIEKIESDTLETLTLPEGISYISGDYAISCKNLENMNFPSTLKRITGNYAIDNTTPLTDLELNEGLEEIGEVSILGGSSILRIHIPSTLTVMPRSFLNQGAHCLWLVIPDGVTSIQHRFLWVNGRVQYVYIPASVTSFGEEIMDDESVKIYTPENSAAARWAADNGHECIICERPEDMPHPEVAYSDDFTYFVNEKEEAVLLKYTGEDVDVVVPDELGGHPVVSVYSVAFFQLGDLHSVHLPESVRRLYPLAFWYCDQLETVYTTADETGINAIDHCPLCEIR